MYIIKYKNEYYCEKCSTSGHMWYWVSEKDLATCYTYEQALFIVGQLKNFINSVDFAIIYKSD